MKESKIVIGANFGDEGKGLVTNHFCEDALNRGLKPVVTMERLSVVIQLIIQLNYGMYIIISEAEPQKEYQPFSQKLFSFIL